MTELRRSIHLPQATAMVVGTIIGASIFVQPSLITGAIPSARGVVLLWAVAGVLTLFGALICAELASAFPKTGGVYVFLREAYSPVLGFLWGWAMFWVMHTGIIAAIAMVLARYVGFYVPLGDGGLKVVAIIAIFVLSGINYLGVRQGSAVQTGFTAGKLLAVVAMIAVAFALGPRVPVPPAAAPVAEIPVREMFVALVAGLFAYGGWHMVTYAAEETVDAERTIPRALVIGTLVVTACYMALNAAYLHVLPMQAVIASKSVAADAADAVLGSGGGAIMSGLVIFSTFGALNGIVLAGPRVYLSMARDGLLFDWAAAVHPTFRTPHRAILLQAVWAAVLVATGSYRALFTRVVYTEWAFFALMAAALFTLRRRAEYAPPYRVWGYPFVPAIFVLASAAIVINEVIAEPRERLLGLALVAAGWPVYHLWTRFGSTRRHSTTHGD